MKEDLFIPDGGVKGLPDALVDALRRFEDRGGGFVAVSGVDSKTFAITVGGYDRVLLTEAQRSADRSRTAFEGGDSATESGAAASAILCAAAACEARLSEYLAHCEFIRGSLPEALEDLRNVWDAREQWKRLLQNRAPSFDTGTSTQYLALGCLFRLRDHIAHRSARLAVPGTFPPRLSDCIRQGTIPARASGGVDWTSAIFVYEVAAWAGHTASEWLKIADEVLPIRC